MRKFLIGLASSAALAACAGGAVPGLMAVEEAPPVSVASAHIAAAIADPRRPEADRERDANRHPREMLAFAQVRPGQVVADFIPGGGYFTRPFAVAVGDEGRVYAVIPPPNPEAERPPAIMAVAEEYENVIVHAVPFSALTLPEPVDVIWTAQNYHDLLVPRFNLDPAAVNRAIYDALKPGGLYVIVDHAALDGTDASVAEELHRINQALVREQVEAVGFVFDGESQVLRNAEDTRDVRVFDESIRGRTDQFVMRFRKPAN